MRRLIKSNSIDISEDVEWWLVVPKRERYSLMLKKGTAPLGLKLLETKCKRGVLVNGFTPATVDYASHPGLNEPPPGAAPALSAIKVGDIFVSIEGESVSQLGLQSVLTLIEQARRRDRLRELMISASAKDGVGSGERKEFTVIFERLTATYQLADLLLDPRKVPFFLDFLDERYREKESGRKDGSLITSPNRVRRATMAGAAAGYSAVNPPTIAVDSWQAGRLGATGHGGGSAFMPPSNAVMQVQEVPQDTGNVELRPSCSPQSAMAKFWIAVFRSKELSAAFPAGEKLHI